MATDQGILKINTYDYEAENIVRFSESDTIPKSRRLTDNLVHDIIASDD